MFALFLKEGRGDSPPGVLCFLTYAMVAFQRGDFLTHFIFPGEETSMKPSLSFFIGIIFLFTSFPAFAVTDVFTNPEDSYVRQTSPATNYGSEPVLIADGVSQDPDNGLYGEIATMVKWDVSSIPSGVTITGVSVTFNFSDASSAPYHFYSQDSVWSEGSVDWNDLNSGPDILGSVPAFTFGNGTINFNATGVAIVQGWVDGSLPNNGFALRTGGTNNGIIMDSKDSTGTPPTLNVTYNNTGQTLAQRVAYLENLLSNVTKVGNNIYITGANLNIRNGLGTTNGNPNDPDSTTSIAVNGLGNLIVGYDEIIDPEFRSSNKSGSHNIVIGHGHNYSSVGGLIAGMDNVVSGPYSTVSAGLRNEASGEQASVSGGVRNLARGRLSSVSGGSVNDASGVSASVSGGEQNEAGGGHSSISGGFSNTTSGVNSSITGGFENEAQATYSTVSGGSLRTAPGTYDWVAGSLFEDQ